MSGTFVDRIDPFAKRSLKKKTKKSQGSSRYRNSQELELQQLPMLKGWFRVCFAIVVFFFRESACFVRVIIFLFFLVPFCSFRAIRMSEKDFFFLVFHLIVARRCANLT